MKYEFPKGFLWGAATAAHQVEGNNINSDSWLLEHVPGGPFKEPSNDACDHLHRYPQDIAQLARLGFNAYRFSIEWARIEPEEGFYSKAMTDHYRRMLAVCHESNITPVVTFHHCTSPRWLISSGGWQDAKTVGRFAKYCGYVTRHLGDLIGYGFTINQPNLPVLWLCQGRLPSVEQLRKLPWVKKAAKAFGVSPKEFRTYTYASAPSDVKILIDAHRCATEAIKAERDSLPVGWTIAADLFVAEQGGEELMDEFRRESIDFFLEASQKDDILGLQAYTKLRIGPNGVQVPPPEAELTESYGWEYYPDALEQSIRYVHTKTNLPILVTENGLATGDDSRRIEWIAHTVKGLKKCLEDGLDVRGYLYWSAMDNFEWEAGYSPRFGIIAVDRDTQKRTIKESAKFLGNIAKTNAIDT